MQMRGEQFVVKVLAGERDFSGIKLEEYFDLFGYEDFPVMQEYLRKADLEKDPVVIDNSDFSYVKARELYLPHVKGKEANLTKADLVRADLREADLEGVSLIEANLTKADLAEANLTKADLAEANLREAYLVRADLREAHIFEANLRRANLMGARLGCANLMASYLGGANLKGANLKGADLQYVENLQGAVNLGYALFLETKVGKPEEIIIEEALKREGKKIGSHLFIVE